VKDDLKSFFSLETFADRRLLKATAMSGLAILFATSLGIFNRILGTVSLTGKQWITCILAGFTVLLVSEARKFVLRRRARATAEQAEVVGALAPEPTAT
jgi:Ca2+-transporting ATPase